MAGVGGGKNPPPPPHFGPRGRKGGGWGGGRGKKPPPHPRHIERRVAKGRVCGGVGRAVRCSSKPARSAGYERLTARVEALGIRRWRSPAGHRPRTSAP